MVEFIGPAILSGGGTAAATSTAVAATGASNLWTALQIGGTAMGALATYGAGRARADEARAAAAEEQLSARIKLAEGKEDEAALNKALAKSLSDQAVAFAGGGVSLNSVSVQQARKQAVDDAENELSLNSHQIFHNQMASKRKRLNLMKSARNSMRSTFFDIAGQGANLGLDLLERG